MNSSCLSEDVTTVLPLDEMPAQDRNQGVAGHHGQRRQLFRLLGSSSWVCFVRPLSLAGIGLAIAIILWGLGYRLSQYRPHQHHAARADVVKLWIGPRGKPATLCCHVKVAVPPSPVLLSVGAPTVSQPSFFLETIVAAIAVIADSRFHSLLHTLRSPPPRSF